MADCLAAAGKIRLHSVLLDASQHTASPSLIVPGGICSRDTETGLTGEAAGVSGSCAGGSVPLLVLVRKYGKRSPPWEPNWELCAICTLPERRGDLKGTFLPCHRRTLSM